MPKRPLITSLEGVHDEMILDVADVAAILNSSTSTVIEYVWNQKKVHERISTGKMKGGFRIGRRLKITAAALRSVITEMTIGPRTPEEVKLVALRASGRRNRRR